MLDSSGNLYGTTYVGGLTCDSGLSHCGIVFKLAPNGVESVVHLFKGAPTDGEHSRAGLLRDSLGNSYGTTWSGGSANGGTVFKIDSVGNESTLHNFKSFSGDGATPYAALIRDGAGNLYGTTSAGGGSTACQGGCGTVFKLTNSSGTWKEVILHRFKGTDGASPYGKLIRDQSGNLYGTTAFGGGSTSCSTGCGTVFKLTPAGTLIVLHNFAVKSNGWSPQAGLVSDSLGNLYGTTAVGGGSSACPAGCGTVFKLDTTQKKTLFHRFTGGADGANPYAELLLNEATHTLYGTAYLGGNQACSTQLGGGPGCGTVFKITYP